jgi:hypothetical protein
MQNSVCDRGSSLEEIIVELNEVQSVNSFLVCQDVPENDDVSISESWTHKDDCSQKLRPVPPCKASSSKCSGKCKYGLFSPGLLNAFESGLENPPPDTESTKRKYVLNLIAKKKKSLSIGSALHLAFSDLYPQLKSGP